jgi:diamine N-acetyltransferase
MITLKGDNIYIRALEPNDLEFIYAIENEQTMWEVSNTNTLQSVLVKQYLENAQQDIYEAKQLRWRFARTRFSCSGLIDLFDFDPKTTGQGGIVIQGLDNQTKYWF